MEKLLMLILWKMQRMQMNLMILLMCCMWMSLTMRMITAAMENMLAQPAQDLETPRSSTEIVSKVLSQTKGTSTFLKNALVLKHQEANLASPTREAQLREQVQAKKQRANLLQEELDYLKKKAEETEESMAKTQEEVHKAQRRDGGVQEETRS
ncbi:unnamed protein product [Miscanthus lutarioriparius]|uniref:Uncharacterized protein n=1 Tax=Miscanthus lutarioriparius TaxID=422564 RepID=A0A811RIV0_9POAL|nr:unnamed protein product [Miscanthus lutarioriparius]